MVSLAGVALSQQHQAPSGQQSGAIESYSAGPAAVGLAGAPNLAALPACTPCAQDYAQQLQGNASLPQPGAQPHSTLALTQQHSGSSPGRQELSAPAPALQKGGSSAAATQLYAINMQFTDRQVGQTFHMQPHHGLVSPHSSILQAVTQWLELANHRGEMAHHACIRLGMPARKNLQRCWLVLRQGNQ